MGSDHVATKRNAPERAPAVERYVLRDRLGEGGMGVVWSARDTRLERDVAVKLLHDRFLGDDHQQQLAREARVMARLSHPNVVAVYDVGVQGGRTFVAMEWVRGASLSEWLTVERTWRGVVDVFRGIADGLAAAHAAGILHRDIKPSNILMGEDGRPRISDFGVAHSAVVGALDPAAPLVATTKGLIGSPAYMSLERISGEPADTRGDQFSFCVTLYEALHGRRPFEAETIGGIIAAIARGAPPPIRSVPPWLHALVARGLAADPADRFPSMIALAAALRGPRSNRVWIAALGSAALTLTVVAVGWRLAGSSAPTAIAAAPLDASLDAPLDGPAIIDQPDAAVAIVPPIISDAAPAAIPNDASNVGQPHPDTNPVRARPTPSDPATVVERTREFRAKWKEAWDGGDFHEARRLAEAAITIDLRNPEPRVLSATASCALGDEPRARGHLGKLPSSEGQSRIAVVRSCRRRGIELVDMLTADEARYAK
ncbi:MAG: protein kinase domain-containing protein [Kofleriaceae bacterium]